MQAYNGLMQSAPVIVFTLLAGPATDKYGRKPMMVFSLTGFLLLNIIMLLNSIWFYQLQVEFLLLECLQDMTGGVAAFFLAAYSYMVDITSPTTRTRRLAILDSFMSIGGLIGLQLGTLLKKKFGFITVFTTGTVVVWVALIYLVFFIKENKTQGEVNTSKETSELPCTEITGVDDVGIRLDKGETTAMMTLWQPQPPLTVVCVVKTVVGQSGGLAVPGSELW